MEKFENRLEEELSKLLSTSSAEELEKYEICFSGYRNLFRKFLYRSGYPVCWENVRALPSGAIKNYCTLEDPPPCSFKDMLNRLVVVKLNGGLGTSMCCSGPKSLIVVRNNMTFLDMTVWQIEDLNIKYDVDVPLVLMNSFCTEEETQKALKNYKDARVTIVTFTQGMYPRIYKDGLKPVATNLREIECEAWYPPGHGSFFEYFYRCGLCEEFVQEGKLFCFVSNIDNLGATVDFRILHLLVNGKEQSRYEFLMEVTDKTAADVKGGTLVHYDGAVRLLEIAQVPKENIDEFQNVDRFEIFNTNNLWIKLESIARLVKNDSFDTEVIVNEKLLNSGVPVIQLETAAGAAMKSFGCSIAINVPRQRFLPVKTTADFLLVKSNLYEVHNGTLVRNPSGAAMNIPTVKLGKEFSEVEEFQTRFSCIPDMLHLSHFRVFGDVTFREKVTLKGTVLIIAREGDEITVEPGSVLEDIMMVGNLKVSTIKTLKK